jgi:hypothetical protein
MEMDLAVGYEATMYASIRRQAQQTIQFFFFLSRTLLDEISVLQASIECLKLFSDDQAFGVYSEVSGLTDCSSTCTLHFSSSFPLLTCSRNIGENGVKC